MIGDDGYLKLIDFGFAMVVRKRTYTIFGTPTYFATEILIIKVMENSRLVDFRNPVYEILA